MRASKIAVSLICALLLPLAISGCSSQQTTTEQAQEEQVLTIGAEGTGTQLTITNDTGKAITKIEVQDSENSEAEPVAIEIANESKQWTNGEKAALYITAGESEGETSDVIFKAAADVTFTTSDEQTYTIHDLTSDGITSMKDASLKISEDGIAYVEYKEGDSSLSTLEAEKAVIAEQQAAQEAAEAEAAAQAAAEAAAAEAAAAQQAAQAQTYSYSYTTPSTSSSAGASSGSGATQSSDQCAPDVILK